MKTVQYPDIGKVHYATSAKAKRISIAIKPEKGIVVTLPPKGVFSEAEAFVLQKKDWILKAKAKIQNIENKQTIFTPDTEFRTKFRLLKIIAEQRNNLQVKVKEQYVEVYYPETFPITHDGVQKAIRKAVEHAWKIEAHEYLPKRLNELALAHKFNYKQLIIKSTRSCWGSCTTDNTISLSLHLMHLPDHLIDYVILHELCHTIQKNHGPLFWDLLNQHTNNRARALAKETKEHSTRIY